MSDIEYIVIMNDVIKSFDCTTHNAPYIHQSHDWILELWQIFSNRIIDDVKRH